MLFFVNLQIRGDGYFLLPRTIDPDLLRSVVLLHTLVLCLTGGWLVAYVARDHRSRSEAVGHSTSMPVVVVLVGVLVIPVLHVVQARRFAEAGYTTSPMGLLLAVAASLALLAALWRASRFWAMVTAAMTLKLYPIAVFPITAKRSDLLPIIDHALRSLWAGTNVWQRYVLDNGILTPNVRFPGVISAYLPAFLLGADLRFVVLASEIAFFAVVRARWGRHPLFIPGCALLLFFPYWHLRHDLYEAPFWVLLVLVILAIDRPVRLALQIPLLAGLVSFHQWGVLLAPYLLVYAARRSSPAQSALLGLTSILLAFLAVWCFSRGDLASFLASTIGSYDAVLRDFTVNRSFPPGSMSLTPWIVGWAGATGVRLINGGAQVVLVSLAAIWLVSLPRLFAFCAASLLLMILSNVVSWTYQYLLVGILLWLGAMARGPRPRQPDIPRGS
jgi:hypothetical protein